MGGDPKGQDGGRTALRRLADAPRELDSRTLFTDTREIIIQHEDERYRLRLTSNNKLILTK
ncbi:hemin uptake protein HemP [Aureimonas sp. OT7]|uniref:hemin uptake protein HemP n=1 Tax=Aureimonas TaxID=414371 RepID=UPI00177C5465|nr:MULTISPECIES: hemin uptake protein HemP [Aureimonas]QOG07176.1 hemin uptake protein HemP [Aureimonas sp. OT7]